MRKMASLVIGAPLAGSRAPNASKYAMRPLRATTATAPGSRFALISACSTWPMRASRSAESPTSCGRADGSACARAAQTDNRAEKRTRTKRGIEPPFEESPGMLGVRFPGCQRRELVLARAEPQHRRELSRRHPAQRRDHGIERLGDGQLLRRGDEIGMGSCQQVVREPLL